jgi:hypothetical protein
MTTVAVLLGITVPALAVVLGINLGLADRITSRQDSARRALSYTAAGFAALACGLVIAALVVAV